MQNRCNHWVVKGVLILWGLSVTKTAEAQVGNFTKFTIEDGLGQSQVYSMIQDKYGMLWAGTLGGISRFDGHEFAYLDKSDGLASALVYALFSDSGNNIWIGTQEGLQMYTGRGFKTVPLPAALPRKNVTLIREDKEGNIYLRCGEKDLVRILNGKPEILRLNAGFSESVISFETDRLGNFFVVTDNKKVYRLNQEKWELFFTLPASEQLQSGYLLFFDSGNDAWFIGSKKVYKYIKGALREVIITGDKNQAPTTAEDDGYGRIWVGTSSGAYRIDKDFSVAYYRSGDGFTDNCIQDILTDKSGNVWFGSEAEGLFRLTRSPFVLYNRNSGLKGNVATGIVPDGDAMWVGTADNGLMKFENGVFSRYTIPSSWPESQMISCVYKDSRSRLWIGTYGGGLWLKEGGKFKLLPATAGNAIISILEDSRGIMWLCSPNGLYYADGINLQKLDDVKDVPFAVLEMGKDTILAGTSAGLRLITGSHKFVVKQLKELNGLGIVCLKKTGDHIIIGTGTDGIFFWNPKTGSLANCNRNNGLTSNSIYSLYPDEGGEVWTGTGNGIHRLRFNEKDRSFTVKKIPVMNSAYGPECNGNSFEKDKDGNLWIGTIRGFFIYKQSNQTEQKTPPLVYLKSVKLFSGTINSPDTLQAWYKIPARLSLKPSENHLTFDFTGIYLTNPAEVQYRYMLEGADTGFSPLSYSSQVIYSNLRPGNYVFRAVAYTNDGTRSSNEVRFPFKIRAHFYQETWFKLLAILGLIGTGFIIKYLRVRIRYKRNQSINKIRREEQQKIQERTSEDLHDDLGNKITRIAVLADVLQNKTSDEDVEKKRLIKQIKENAQALYLGTKDIIWSMTPGNDNLFDFFERIKSFGAHLFEDTDVEFSVTGLKNEFRSIKIPLDISRNLMMVVKESLNNILKHADADRAVAAIELLNDFSLSIVISDNGSGIESAGRSQGNGIRNIEKRIARIGGGLTIKNNKPQGTVLSIDVKIPLKEGLEKQ